MNLKKLLMINIIDNNDKNNWNRSRDDKLLCGYIIINKQGNRTTPSYIYIDENNQSIVGEQAKNNLHITNVVYDIKRLIGLKYNDTNVQKYIKHVPYKIKDSNNANNANNSNNEIVIEINEKNYTPIELSSILLKEMKEIAENYVGDVVTSAVITVPAYFNDAQRQATKDAGLLAGLDVLRIINEPTAAAIAYGLDINKDINVLVYDLGGGTLDVSLLNICGNVFEVIATSGDTHLGGEDFNNQLVIYCIKEFKRMNKHIDINAFMTNKKVLNKLHIHCENAKIVLSKLTQTSIEIDSLYDGIDFRLPLSRAKFEDICGNEFHRCLKPIEQVLNDSKLSKNDIHDIVLVGGSTRIPKIYTMIQQYFNKDPKNNINPDEAIAYGASIQASILSKENINYELVLLDVVPLSLGIETDGRLMTKILNRNTKIPCSVERIFTTHTNNQPDVTIKIYEGEREFTKYNNLLGIFTLSDIPPMPRGDAKIIVKFSVDVNGILNVSAKEESTNISKQITIKKNHICSDELAKTLLEYEKMDQIDKIEKDKLFARTKLENYLYGMKNYFADQEVKMKLNENINKDINDKFIDTIQWLCSTQNISELDYKNKIIELDNYIKPILANLRY
jgi:molecular chaperone DnaK (HSP70)